MKLIIDTDTGADDAVALIMALRHPDTEVLAITTLMGNVELDQATRNAVYVTELCDADVPVYPGSGRPLVREPHYAHGHHGLDGLGDQGFRPQRRAARDEHAVDVLISMIRLHASEATLVTLGPLTNVALALRRDPHIAGMVKRCVVMGGTACSVGNVTPAAEFNVYVDPEAAQIVFSSGMRVQMVGWELCRGPACLDDDEMDRLRALNTKYARFTLDANAQALRTNRERLGEPGVGFPDPIAMAIALDPLVATEVSAHHVAVETSSELTRGMTVVDKLGVTGRGPNVDVCWQIDIPRWKQILYRALT